MKLARSTRAGTSLRSVTVETLAVTVLAVSPVLAPTVGPDRVSAGRPAAVGAGAAGAARVPSPQAPATRHTDAVAGMGGTVQPQALASTSGAEPKVESRRVCVRRANVRSGPGLSHRVVTTLGRGTRVNGPVTRGWIKLQNRRWMSVSVTCRVGGGATASGQRGEGAFRAWARVIDPAGNAQWKLDHTRAYTRGNVRGLTVFRGRGPGRSTVYIQPGMTWSKTKMVMAHEALHVRQIRYGGFAHSLRVFGTLSGMERAADCGATMVLRYVVRGGCGAGVRGPVLNLLAGRPA